MSRAVVLNPGQASAPALVLDQPLSFWGGYDPVTGKIIDQRHPQAGIQVGGKILIIPGSRGSAGTPAGIAESIRLKVGPAAVILGKADVNIAIGAAVAARLYDIHTPVLVTDRETLASVTQGEILSVGVDGAITR